MQTFLVLIAAVELRDVTSGRWKDISWSVTCLKHHVFGKVNLFGWHWNAVDLISRCEAQFVYSHFEIRCQKFGKFIAQRKTGSNRSNQMKFQPISRWCSIAQDLRLWFVSWSLGRIPASEQKEGSIPSFLQKNLVFLVNRKSKHELT